MNQESKIPYTSSCVVYTLIIFYFRPGCLNGVSMGRSNLEHVFLYLSLSDEITLGNKWELIKIWTHRRIWGKIIGVAHIILPPRCLCRTSQSGALEVRDSEYVANTTSLNSIKTCNRFFLGMSTYDKSFPCTEITNICNIFMLRPIWYEILWKSQTDIMNVI